MKNTTLCYIEKDGQYLMLHRIKKLNDMNKDKWIGIGGKFEEGESPEECAIREIFEETGLKIPAEKLEYRGIVTFLDKTDSKNPYGEFMHLFYTKTFPQNIIDCDEGVLEWIDIKKLNELPHWKGDEIFLDLIQKKVPFFSLKLVYSNGNLIDSILNGKKLEFQKDSN